MKTKTKRQCEIRDNAMTWAPMTPVLIFMLAFTVSLIFRSLYLSLSKYRLGMDSAEFIGLENYVKLAGSKLFWKMMKNTVVFVLMTVIPSMAVGLDLAILVNHKGKGVEFIRAVYFYPVVMPMIIIAGMRVFIYVAKNGLSSQLLIVMGLRPMNVLSSKNTILPVIAVMYVWEEAGYPMVFSLSGVQSISDEVMEAARADGVGSWTVLRRITIPLLTPTLLSMSIIAFTNYFKLVDYVVVMTEGAPNNASTLLLYYIYQQGFTGFNYDVSSAPTVVVLRFLLTVSLPRFVSQDRKMYYD